MTYLSSSSLPSVASCNFLAVSSHTMRNSLRGALCRARLKSVCARARPGQTQNAPAGQIPRCGWSNVGRYGVAAKVGSPAREGCPSLVLLADFRLLILADNSLRGGDFAGCRHFRVLYRPNIALKNLSVR